MKNLSVTNAPIGHSAKYSVWPSLGLPSTRRARWEARESLNGPLPGGLLFQQAIHF
jgi:hypothetical protein